MLSFIPDGLRETNFWAVLFRLVLAMFCGAAIGVERSYKNRPAGLRTHILVCLGAAIASMTGIYLYLEAHIPTDVSRIGAQVVSGLGFIGAGTIIVTRNRTVKGLTTASGLWASGIIGLAVGAAFYEGAVIATLLVLFAEVVISRLGMKIHHTPEFEIRLHYEQKSALDDVMRYFKDHKVSIMNLRVVSPNNIDATVYTAVMLLRPRNAVNRELMLSHIRTLSGVLDVEES